MGGLDEELERDREWYREALSLAFAQFDRTVLTLASGGLAISLVFVHNVAPEPTHVGWLVASWVSFAVSLSVILASFITSQVALVRGYQDPDSGGGPWRRTTWVLNIGSALAFLLGVLALAIFATLNV